MEKVIRVGDRVRQAGGIPELVGREGIVDSFFRDEKGAIHCKVDTASGDWFWCPADLLEVQTSAAKE